MQTWRSELRAWAEQVAQGFVNRPGILGVLIGGSLARGQEWRHSDLELGALVEQRDPHLSYFNVLGGRGVEVIQLARPELAKQLSRVEAGDLAPLCQWPIQLWRGRLVHDPTGLLARFKRQFDAGLFRPEVLEQRSADLQEKITQALNSARALLTAGRPAAALVHTRLAMNNAILVFHWAHGELPRSQNRTDSRLRQLCHTYAAPAFYALYRQIFDLEGVNRLLRSAWPGLRSQVLELTRLWGQDARDFFDIAVDSHFAWRQNAGILTVYRLYIPIIGGEQHGLIGKLDDPAWQKDNPQLLAFLGLDQAKPDRVAVLIDRLEQACAAMARQPGEP